MLDWPTPITNYNMDRVMQREILKKFKNHGWSINSAALKGLLSVLGKEDDKEDVLQKVISEITERVEKRELRTTVIDVEVMEDVCASLSTDDNDLQIRKFQLVDAFSQPRISYDATQKSYSLDAAKYSLHGNVEHRAEMYRERIHLATQRAHRMGVRMSGMSSRRRAGDTEVGDEISTIESLLGDTGVARILLGMLTQPEEGKWYLEDLTGSMWLDFSTLMHKDPRIYTEGSIVLVKGHVSERNSNRLSVAGILMLPPEDRSSTLKAMDITDPLDVRLRPREMIAKHQAEVADKNVAIVIISDCCFANAVVCDNLRMVFQNYENTDTELLFVLLGPFSSKDFLSTGGREAAEVAFAAFGETLSECPRLCEESRFLLVPSTKDAGTKAAWPRRPLPEELVKPLRRRIKKLTLASNPCRVLFYNQELVFFREDMMKKMQRHALQVRRGRLSLCESVSICICFSRVYFVSEFHYLFHSH